MGGLRWKPASDGLDRQSEDIADAALGLYDPKAIEAPRIQAWRPETDGELDP